MFINELICKRSLLQWCAVRKVRHVPVNVTKGFPGRRPTSLRINTLSYSRMERRVIRQIGANNGWWKTWNYGRKICGPLAAQTLTRWACKTSHPSVMTLKSTITRTWQSVSEDYVRGRCVAPSGVVSRMSLPKTEATLSKFVWKNLYMADLKNFHIFA